MLKRFHDLKGELREFLVERKKLQWAALLTDEIWCVGFCYLVDIFDKLNNLNLSLQGKDANLMDFVDKLSGFIAVVQLWIRRADGGRMGMFGNLTGYLDEQEISLPDDVKLSILDHLKKLVEEFERYFPDIGKNTFNLVRDPFKADVDACLRDDQ